MKLLLGSGGIGTPKRKKAWNDAVDEHLQGIDEILFVPYALANHDKYVEMISEHFAGGRKVVGIHTKSDPVEAVQDCAAVYVGGGNSFRLLNSLYEKKLLDPIREKVRAGTPYLGVSAGTNMACPTLMTTNDMPIVQPPSFQSLNLINFQINPHFVSGKAFFQREGEELMEHRGETRETRLREYHEMNDVPILGMSEGTVLKVSESQKFLTGVGYARLFLKGKDAVDFPAGTDLTAQLP